MLDERQTITTVYADIIKYIYYEVFVLLHINKHIILLDPSQQNINPTPIIGNEPNQPLIVYTNKRKEEEPTKMTQYIQLDSLNRQLSIPPLPRQSIQRLL
jgi:hypothetical protein